MMIPMESKTATLLVQLQDWLLRRVPPSGIRRVLPVSAALGSDIGSVRKENQDRAAIARGRDGLGQQYIVAAIADGIGGLKHGAQCAALAVSAVIDTIQRKSTSGLPPVVWADEAVKSAHEKVRETYKGAGGATLVVLLITENDGFYWASIGDSRFYISARNSLLQISTDDTIAGQLGRRAGTDGEQGKLIQYIGIDGEIEFNVSKLTCPFDSTAFLTTDGIHFIDSSSEILSILIQNSPDLGSTTRRLTDLARWAGGPDNATLVALSLDFSDYERGPMYPCLDVWDAFGEIRFSLASEHQHSIHQSDRIEKKDSRATATVKTEEAQDLNAAPSPPTPKGDDRKPLKLKSKAGKSKAKKRNPTAERGTTVPQVQLEFSNKKD